MKITCQSCQAKYTIADEKVVGKTVKIKCKKCGATIVVNGNEVAPAAAPGSPVYPGRLPMDEEGATRVFSGPEPGAAPGADEWTVNVSDEDQRTMTSAQLAQAYAAGTISGETYVWRDGMGDWLPLSSVPELASAVSRPGPAAGAGYGAPASYPPPGDADEGAHDNASTVAFAVSPFHQPGAQAAYAAATAPAADPAPTAAATAAARRATAGRGGVDLFGGSSERRAEGGGMFPAGQAAAAASDDRLVGERNENSVLFSLSALTASESANRPGRGGGGRDDAVIDMRPSPGASGRRDVDDIMNIGGGGFQSPMLAPPPLLAPVVEAPQPSMPVGAYASMPAPVGGTGAPEKKSSMVGLIAGVALGIAIVGGAAIYFLRPPPPVAAKTEATAAAATPSAIAAIAAAAPTPTATAAPAPTAAAAPTETAAAAAPTDSPSAKPAAVAAAAPKGADKPAPGPGPAAAAPMAAAKPEKTAEPPAAATAAPAAAGGNEFNRGAAASALGGAAGGAKGCKKPDGPTGTGRVKVTFAPSGNVTSAVVDGPPFSGTSVGGCIAAAFRGAHVPPFDGAPVVVSKSFTIN